MITKGLKVILSLFFLYCAYKAHTTHEKIYVLFTAYALGSIPFGLILTRVFTGLDISSIGSGNIGATNVLRSGSKILAAATLALDMLKGSFATLIASSYGTPDLNDFLILLAGGLAIIGHSYPIWLNFKGGKGIATILGILLTLSWVVALISVITWLIVAKLTRISSLAGLISITIAPIVGYFVGNGIFALFLFALAVLIYIRHIDNIKRLFQGKEPRIGDSR